MFASIVTFMYIINGQNNKEKEEKRKIKNIRAMLSYTINYSWIMQDTASCNNKVIPNFLFTPHICLLLSYIDYLISFKVCGLSLLNPSWQLIVIQLWRGCLWAINVIWRISEM